MLYCKMLIFVKFGTDRLLNNLTQALEGAGIDLSQANISVQIDLGKRANRGLMSEASIAKVYSRWMAKRFWSGLCGLVGTGKL